MCRYRSLLTVVVVPSVVLTDLSAFILKERSFHTRVLALGSSRLAACYEASL